MGSNSTNYISYYGHMAFLYCQNSFERVFGPIFIICVSDPCKVDASDVK